MNTSGKKFLSILIGISAFLLIIASFGDLQISKAVLNQNSILVIFFRFLECFRHHLSLLFQRKLSLFTVCVKKIKLANRFCHYRLWVFPIGQLGVGLMAGCFMV